MELVGARSAACDCDSPFFPVRAVTLEISHDLAVTTPVKLVVAWPARG
jgi:hypothetical protein